MLARCISCWRKISISCTWFTRTAFVCPANKSILSWLAPLIAPDRLVVGSPLSSKSLNKSSYNFKASAYPWAIDFTLSLNRCCSSGVKPSKEPPPSSLNPYRAQLLTAFCSCCSRNCFFKAFFTALPNTWFVTFSIALFTLSLLKPSE